MRTPYPMPGPRRARIPFVSPLLLAVEQLDDPAFLGVLVRSLVWAVVAFVALLAACGWAMNALAGHHGWLGWAAGLLGGLGAALLAVWLFVPAALLIATLYLDRVCAAVDRRFYPSLPQPVGAPLTVQVWDGVALGGRVLCWQVVALLAALFLPGIGLLLGWAITGWAIGRGLFVAVAMRRMPRHVALEVYGRRRLAVLLQGALLALLGTIPFLNLLVPVLGIAALTHVLNADGGYRLALAPAP